MDNRACNKIQPSMRKVKKKYLQDEHDRKKQVEKKKRRLEKTLANSAAITSELEKKKQKKREERQKLDEEGAAIAEAVVLRVLIGGDLNDSCKIVLNKDEECHHWDCSSNAGLFTGGQRNGFARQDSANRPQRIQWITNAYRPGYSELSYSSGCTETLMPGILKKLVGKRQDSLLVLSQWRLFHPFKLLRVHTKIHLCSIEHRSDFDTVIGV